MAIAKKVIMPYSYKLSLDNGRWYVFDEWGNPLESFTDEEDAFDLTENLNVGVGYGNESGIQSSSTGEDR